MKSNKECIEVLKQSGIYILFGVDENNEEQVAYIGQSRVRKNGEGILRRLYEHKRDESKDYWNEAVIMTTSNNSFGPTEISYLENRLCNIAIECDRVTVKNGNDSTIGNITEEKESELEEFIEYAKIIIGTLGYKIFVPLVKIDKEDSYEIEEDIKNTYYLKRKSRKSNQTIEAKCEYTNEGFVVLKGSMIEIVDSDRIPKSIKEKRLNVSLDKNNILQEDVLFKSPSYATSFVLGGHVNGKTEWKNSEGVSISELEETN